jgi:hypothetical protein
MQDIYNQLLEKITQCAPGQAAYSNGTSLSDSKADAIVDFDRLTRWLRLRGSPSPEGAVGHSGAKSFAETILGASIACCLFNGPLADEHTVPYSVDFETT